MQVGKRFLAGLTILLSAVGLLLSLAGGVGVWIVNKPVILTATGIFERVEAALDVADRGLDQVKASLARAAERLDSAREEQRQLAQTPQQNNVLRKMLARTIQQGIAPQIGDAHEKLHTVAEAAVVVNSVLEDVGNLPFSSVAGLDLGRLTEMNNRLDDLGPAAWELSRLLGQPGPETDADAANMQLSRMEQTLTNMQGLIAAYEPQVTQIRDRTRALMARTLRWIMPASVLISFVCFWIALSQVSLIGHARSWWVHSGRTELKV